MFKYLYLLFISLSVSSLLITFGLLLFLLEQVEQDLGNGGGFLLGLSWGVVLVGASMSSVFSFISGSILFVFQDILPSTVLYQQKWSLVAFFLSSSLILFSFMSVY